MEQASFNGSKRHEEPGFDLKEWALKAKISRENTSSRRFSASNLKSFREEAKSFRSSVTISSTVSSPGYTVREEIDPSTYSFTTALKALQAKTVYTWEYLKPDGYTLNSKWSDAEKYICNPISGEVPLECLSAKTLSGRSFRSLTSRITMSAPLIYPSSQLHNQFQAQTPIIEHDDSFRSQEKNKSKPRDVGIQSSLVGLSWSSPSPAKTPSIEERSIKQSELETEDSPLSSEKMNEEIEVVQAKGTGDDDRKKKFTETHADNKVRKLHKKKKKKKMMMMRMCLCNNGGDNQEEEEDEKESHSCPSLKKLMVSRRNIKNKQKSSDACNM